MSPVVCFVIGGRPRVIETCSLCSRKVVHRRCQQCGGRGHVSHEVNFGCDCAGCEFRGEPHAGQVKVISFVCESLTTLSMPPSPTRGARHASLHRLRRGRFAARRPV